MSSATTTPSPQAFDEATVYHRRGDWPKAEALYRTVLAADRGHAGALHHLGILRSQQGKADEAVGLMSQALEHDPHNAETHNNLGVALQALGRWREALQRYEQAIAIKPALADAHYNLGTVLQALGRHADAIERYERAVLLRPSYAAAHHALAGALHSQRRPSEALARYEQALAIVPDHVDALAGRGAALAQLGHLDEARDSFARAIELAPRRAGLYRNLAECQRFAPDDPHLAAMEALLADAGGLRADDQVALHAALAKAYADIEQRERSFDHLRRGNALKRQRVAYDEPASLGLLQRAATIFTRDLMRRHQGLGDPSFAPVFIVGMPHTGTDLVEQILARHPGVQRAAAPWNFSKAAADLRAAANPAARFPESVPDLTGDELRAFGSRYLAALGGAPTALRIVDPFANNFLFAGLIHLALPNARIIHTYRDPVDTCVTCFSRPLATGQPYAFDLGELGRYCRAYEELMAHWRRVLPVGVMIEVRYEDLVTNPEGEARRTVAHCSLDWNDACGAFQGDAAGAPPVDRAALHRSPIGRAPSDSAWLQPLLDALEGEPPHRRSA